MKPVLAMTLVAGLVVAQDISQIPECAKGCVSKLGNSGGVAGCKQADIKCVCSNTSFLGTIACCLKDACSEADQQTTVDFAKTLCSSSGVQVPDKIECKEAAASNSSGSASSSSETGTAAGSSSTGSATGSSSTGTAKSSSSGSSSTSTPTPGAAASIGGVGSVAGAVLAMLAAL